MTFNAYANRDITVTGDPDSSMNRDPGQDVAFSESEGRSINILSADPGVTDGLSTTAANGTSGSGKDFVSKNS